MIYRKKILLLLSGGKDSLNAIAELKKSGYDVTGLCIDGIQGHEKSGALKAAQVHDIPLLVKNIWFFDENTWNPVKLIFRDLAMGFVAIREAKRIQSVGIATGVKQKDLANPKLAWLRVFLCLSKKILSLFGLDLIYPVWKMD